VFPLYVQCIPLLKLIFSSDDLPEEGQVVEMRYVFILLKRDGVLGFVLTGVAS